MALSLTEAEEAFLKRRLRKRRNFGKSWRWLRWVCLLLALMFVGMGIYAWHISNLLFSHALHQPLAGSSAATAPATMGDLNMAALVRENSLLGLKLSMLIYVWSLFHLMIGAGLMTFVLSNWNRHISVSIEDKIIVELLGRDP